MPVAIVFICCSRLIVGILYSQEFYAVLPYVAIGACGVFFRAASWCVAYTILAKGDGRIYVCTEAASAIAYLALHIPLYNAFGFTGLGIAYVAWYAVYFLSVCAVYRFRYKLGFPPGIITLTPLRICLCGSNRGTERHHRGMAHTAADAHPRGANSPAPFSDELFLHVFCSIIV